MAAVNEVSNIAIKISNVKKKFLLYHERHQTIKETILARRRSSYTELWALNDVSIDFQRGKTYGIIGENGSGKSTLLKMATRILRPDEGSVEINGRISALLELGAGFHPDLTGRENIFLNGAILRLSKAEIMEKYDEIVAFSEIGEFIDTPVKNYSSGMYMRLGFAIAVNVDPDILLIDEVLAVGDEAFQKKCFEKLKSIQDSGKTIIFVSHDAEAVRSLCNQAILMDKGKVIASGAAGPVIDKYHAILSSRETAPENLQTREAVEDASKRFGTGEVTMTRVSVMDGSGKEAAEFAPGQEVVLRIDHKINNNVDNPSFGLIVYDKNGVLTYSTSSRWQGMELRELRTGESVTVEYRLQARLLKGVYSFTAGVAVTDGSRFYDWWEECGTMSIKGDDKSTGLADLQGTVSVLPEDAVLKGGGE